MLSSAPVEMVGNYARLQIRLKQKEISKKALLNNINC